ncbi:efflux RND transporter periplasmic adaptor subunit [Pseudenhygromyxa sp. WMMC2535]|uniref:efflux RND transporter periplasmic adaptor subunit n=1 Tax=Pseudenhygromyxa sp. WMMC2535 TaxID=2712867 RepID=UPI0015567196|nr:efflux RND transporter periplasmic adaptor subunit [Pseudenhygromyxa sp. WMMC2535]NVB40566.1 efflux RND transporter periplasmic adaptor subunit [Pseudenhygromyxa sp. WMMC2535]
MTLAKPEIAPIGRFRPAPRQFALALALTLGATTGCPGGPGGPGGRGGPGGEGAEAAGEAEEQPTPVLLTAVERGTIEGKIRAASTIEAEMQVTVHAESTGRLTSLSFEEGDEVKKGQTLARIRREAQALGFERAESSLADAQREFERVERLFKQGIASQSEYDEAESSLELARLDKRDRSHELSNTVIKAPFDGVVTQRFVDEGGFVSSGAQVLEVTDFDTLVARVYVPEKELDRLEEGQSAEVVGKAAKDRQGVGTVKRIAPIVDATTGTVKVTIGLPPELTGGAKGFLPGMYAEVTLTTEVHADVLVVPKPALVHEEEQTFVFIADGERAKKVLLETGLSNEDFVEVGSGLSEGARVIVAGQAGLKDGALIMEVDARGTPLADEQDAAGEAEAPAQAEAPADAEAGPGEGAAARAKPDEVAKAG